MASSPHWSRSIVNVLLTAALMIFFVLLPLAIPFWIAWLVWRLGAGGTVAVLSRHPVEAVAALVITGGVYWLGRRRRLAHHHVNV